MWRQDKSYASSHYLTLANSGGPVAKCRTSFENLRKSAKFVANRLKSSYNPAKVFS